MNPLIIALAISGSVWAQDPASEEGVPAPILVEEAAPLDGTIVKLPLGSYVRILQEDGTHKLYKVPSKHWLLPDSYYREAVTMGKHLKICQPALDTCTETSLAWQERTYTALNTCSEQFEVDGTRLTDLIAQNEQMAFKLSKARSNQVVAWAITSGLLVGAGTALVVTFAAK